MKRWGKSAPATRVTGRLASPTRSKAKQGRPTARRVPGRPHEAARDAAQMDGCPRQNPAYRPATRSPASAGLLNARVCRGGGVFYSGVAYRATPDVSGAMHGFVVKRGSVAWPFAPFARPRPARGRRRRPAPAAGDVEQLDAGRCRSGSAGSTTRWSPSGSRPSIVRRSSSGAPGRPRLRAARGRVLDRVLGQRRAGSRRTPRAAGRRRTRAASRMPAAMLRGLVLEAVAAQTPGDERVVERPDGADVVADRVVARPRPRPACARPSRRTGRGPIRCRTTAFALDLSTMPLHSRWPMFEVSASTWLPSASSASAKYSPSATQKSRLKRRLRSAASLLQLVGELGVVPDLAGQPGAAHLGVVGVALQLAGGAREAGQPAVAVGDRVPGVLPALVLQAGLLVAALVRRCSRCPAGRRTRRSSRSAARASSRARAPASCRRSSARTRRAARRTAASRRRVP